jgi:ring-1,2-phenylacetyl-CoA epoxidase subunit PaaE
LSVAAIDELTEDAIAITFDVPSELEADYAFVQGQHVAIRAPEIGDDLRRSYSICSSAGSGVLRIAVKRLPRGRLSCHLKDHLRPGNRLEVMTPTGRFFTPLHPENEKRYVAIAAGSGITPIISIVATTLFVEPKSQFTLVYGNRSTNSIMFLEELADLKDRYPDRFALHHVLSGEPTGIDVMNGRIGREKIRRFAAHVLFPAKADEWFLCGPQDMVEEIAGTLAGLGVDRDHIHRELFYVGPSQPRNAPRSRSVAEVSRVTVMLNGRAVSFELPRGGDSILDALLSLRGDAPYACKGGVCGTCRGKLLDGHVELDRSYALEERELREGFILMCQARPQSDAVLIDVDV